MTREDELLEALYTAMTALAFVVETCGSLASVWSAKLDLENLRAIAYDGEEE